MRISGLCAFSGHPPQRAVVTGFKTFPTGTRVKRRRINHNPTLKHRYRDNACVEYSRELYCVMVSGDFYVPQFNKNHTRILASAVALPGAHKRVHSFQCIRKG